MAYYTLGSIHKSPSGFGLDLWFHSCYYEERIAGTNLDFVADEFVACWQEVGPFNCLEKFLFAQVPLEPFCLNVVNFPKRDHPAALFLYLLRLDMNGVIDFSMQVYHKWVLTEKNNVFGRRCVELLLCGTHPWQYMIDATGIKVKDYNLIVFHFVTETQSFLEICSVLIWVVKHINAFFVIVAFYLLFNAVKVTDDTSDLFGVLELRCVNAVGTSVH